MRSEPFFQSRHKPRRMIPNCFGPRRVNLLADTDHTVHWDINGSLQKKSACGTYVSAT